MTFEELLPHLGKNIELHAKLVNTFSLMEYIGARKILKSQKTESIVEPTLSHVAEEIRHSQTLKRLAMKLSASKLSSYAFTNILGNDAAKTYMQTVDHGCAEVLGSIDPFKNYIFTTWLIEERALKVYPVYEEILANLGYPGYFQAILNDEEKHLKFVKSKMDGDHVANKMENELLKQEFRQFSQFIAAINNNVTKLVVCSF